MRHLPSNPDAALREAIQKGNIVFVVGTGVSMSATYDSAKKACHPQASWTGLLTHGLNTAARMGRLTKGKEALYLNLLAEDPTTENLISVASVVTNALGGAKSHIFEQWLKDTVGEIRPLNREVIDALHALREAENLLATTNYDDILLDHPTTLKPITWMDGDEIVGAQRNREIDKIIYLHGYWQRPETVILGGVSYNQITRHKGYRDDLAALWRTTTWVYVGCGESGLSDPDFGLLLEHHGERARDAEHWDFCLVAKTDQKAFQKVFNDLNLNIVAVSYGDRHDALSAFLRSMLPAPAPAAVPASPVAAPSASAKIPAPPAFYAEHDYIGRHTFVGRKTELQILTDWATPTDPTSILLFEAIGGNGKSMLTWEWATKHAPGVRDWAGRFWYSFYEKGAVMRGFCQHALAYMTEKPLETFDKWTMADLRKELLLQLHQKPWLLVLDGLERVLVAYHRIDASEVPDEEVNHPTDKILDRDPCDAIRDEDTDLLRALAGAGPSKILVSSRLIPRVLLNQAGIPLPGVKPLTLPGLDETDAEALLRACGVRGTSADIRYYLTTYCANHPLVIGVLAGLIHSPGPHRGDFDAWAADPEYGAKLNLASLDLIQRRNHILRAALDALQPASRQLLSTLALLSDAVDYATVAAFNPHLPPEPEEVEEPTKPEEIWKWKFSNDGEKAVLRKEYNNALGKRKAYEQVLQAWRDSSAVREAQKKLAETTQDLEHRGLLQYDARTRRYDMHPVVRGVAAGGMRAEDKELYGRRVVDYFASRPHSPYGQAKTMEDLENGLHVVRTLLKLGQHQQAIDALEIDLASAFIFNIEAYTEALSLLRPFFSAGWNELPKGMSAWQTSYLASVASISLMRLGEYPSSLSVLQTALYADLGAKSWKMLRISIDNMASNFSYQNKANKSIRITTISRDLAIVTKDEEAIFSSSLECFNDQSRFGQWEAAEATWRRLDPMGRAWSRAVYRQGMAEESFARFQFWQGTLHEDHLKVAETLAAKDDNRSTIRQLHRLRGAWRLEQSEWALAVESFDAAVTMARERRLVDATSEAGLTLAKFHVGQITDDAARNEAERLAQVREPAHRTLALLWLAMDDLEQAKAQALEAYRWAWAEGEPYVNRYALVKATELLQQMHVPIPELPPYDLVKDEPFPWEADVRAAIEKLRAAKGNSKR